MNKCSTGEEEPAAVCEGHVSLQPRTAWTTEAMGPQTLGNPLHTCVCKIYSHLGNCVAVTWETTHTPL